MKTYFLILGIILLTGCGGSSGGGGKSNDEEPTHDDPIPVGDDPVPVGYYPAKDGSGYTVFYDLEMPADGYLDITTFRSSVSLHDLNLSVIHENLKSEEHITKGSYKVKMTYNPTSLIPGNVTVFSLALTPYDILPTIESMQYRATGSFGTYSEYYKLDMSRGGYIDVTTSKAEVFAYNFTENADSGLPLTDHYVKVNGTHYLDPGLYIVKFTYQATSWEPGSVSFFYSRN